MPSLIVHCSVTERVRYLASHRCHVLDLYHFQLISWLVIIYLEILVILKFNTGNRLYTLYLFQQDSANTIIVAEHIKESKIFSQSHKVMH
jgi:hypothetical protein